MKKYNSVKTMVQVLKEVGPMTEHEIQMTCFGYDRNNSIHSNKKYADMLRRGLKKGLYKRMKFDKGFSKQFPQSEYFYYTNELC